MKKKLFYIVFILLSISCPSIAMDSTQINHAQITDKKYNLAAIIDFAFKHNPKILSFQKEIENESYNITATKADEKIKVDLTAGITGFRYPVTEKPFIPSQSSGLPSTYYNLSDIGIIFKMPLYRAGKIERNILIAETKKQISIDAFTVNKQELAFNLSSVFFKIIQLEKLLEANNTTIKQLEAHKKNIELFIKSGMVPQIDLLKIGVELSYAKKNRLIVRNNLEGSHDLLKTLMGIDDVNKKISIINENIKNEKYPAIEQSINNAFLNRSEYSLILKKKKIYEQRIELARSRKKPDISLMGELYEKTGKPFAFKENWNIGVRLTYPVFDGGIIESDIHKEINEMEKINEEERAVKLNIIYEIKNAYRDIETATERIEVINKSIESAREALRIEQLKYNTGTGTNTDVIDAEAILLRTETDYYQAVFDKEIAIASLKKAIGE